MGITDHPNVELIFAYLFHWLHLGFIKAPLGLVAFLQVSTILHTLTITVKLKDLLENEKNHLKWFFSSLDQLRVYLSLDSPLLLAYIRIIIAIVFVFFVFTNTTPSGP